MSESTQTTSLVSDLEAEDDLLDFAPYSLTLLDIIRDPQTKGPLVIGLFGTWGSGKSSLMRFVERELRVPAKDHQRSFRVAWFDAWKYEKEEALWRALLLRVVDELRDRDADGKDITPKERKEAIEKLEQRFYRDVDWEEKGGLTVDWSKLVKGAATGAIQFSFAFLPGLATLTEAVKAAQGAVGKAENANELVEAFRRDVIKHHQDQLRSIEQFQKEFGDLIREHVMRHGQRLVGFVDDLDRCLPEKTFEVLEAIKLFLDVKGCIFLLGLDQEVVTRGIKVKYRDFAIDESHTKRVIPIDGAAYLEKIIQLPFRLPKIEPRAMQPFIHGLAAFPDARCENVFAEGLETNPRKVKRAINIFLFISKLADKRNIPDIKPVRLAKIVVIYHSHPLLYERLRDAPYLLPLLEEYYRKQEAQTPREQLRAPRAEEGVDAAAAAKQVVEPPAALAGLLKPELKNVMALFLDDPDACFAVTDDKGRYLDFGKYFTLTRGAIAEAPAPTAAEAASRLTLAFPAPTFVRVPAGEFLMGTSDAEIEYLLKTTDWAKEWKEKDYFKSEQAQHRVALEEFQIGKYPVTNAEYQAFVRDAQHQPPSHWSGDTFPEELAAHPVVNVSWQDGDAYCQWLTQKLRDAKQLRESEVICLPTEAEWEKAAAWDDGKKARRIWAWGNTWDASKCNTAEGGAGTMAPVGKYSPAGDSFFTAADMTGNVWEWCADWYDENYYKNSPRENPRGPESRQFKVLRGGSRGDDQYYARCAYRFRLNPDYWNYYFNGFRCARGSSS